MNETHPVLGSAPQEKTSGLAIASVVLGTISLLCFLTGIPGVICGHMALSQIKKSGGILRGNGLAIGGLALGYISIVIFSFLAAIAIPNFVRARHMAQQKWCINNLRQMEVAKQQWALENKKAITDVPTFQDIAPFIISKDGRATATTMLICPAGGTYIIGSVHTACKCSIPSHRLE